MSNSEEALQRILKKEPHLTRAEAVKLIGLRRAKRIAKKETKHCKSIAQKRRYEGLEPKGSVYTVSGGKVSPK